MLTSCPTSEEDIGLMRRTQYAFKQYGNLRLHKFTSNREEVIQAFEPKDLAQDICDFNLDKDQLIQSMPKMKPV